VDASNRAKLAWPVTVENRHLVGRTNPINVRAISSGQKIQGQRVDRAIEQLLGLGPVS